MGSLLLSLGRSVLVHSLPVVEDRPEQSDEAWNPLSEETNSANPTDEWRCFGG